MTPAAWQGVMFVAAGGALVTLVAGAVLLLATRRPGGRLDRALSVGGVPEVGEEWTS